MVQEGRAPSGVVVLCFAGLSCPAARRGKMIGKPLGRGKGKEEADERVNGTEGSAKGRRERSSWHCEHTKQNELG